MESTDGEVCRAISLWQPWASLWIAGPKLHETRHWPTKYRGRLYVHAAKRPIRRAELSPELIEICEEEFGEAFTKALPLGQVIGIVNLIDCIQVQSEGPMPPDITIQDLACGDFSPGRYLWKRGPNPTPIGPWPYKGKQGFFRVDDLDAVANRELGIVCP
jgi:activating signal cointegrator 1